MKSWPQHLYRHRAMVENSESGSLPITEALLLSSAVVVRWHHLDESPALVWILIVMASSSRMCREIPYQDFSKIKYNVLSKRKPDGTIAENDLFGDPSFPPDLTSLTYVYSGDDRYERTIFKRPKVGCYVITVYNWLINFRHVLMNRYDVSIAHISTILIYDASK